MHLAVREERREKLLNAYARTRTPDTLGSEENDVRGVIAHSIAL